MKKKILSAVSTMLIVCMMFCSSILNVGAEECTNRLVDGSYLTMDDSATDKVTEKLLSRGKHLMDGTVTITKAGIKKISVYGSTTANHTVDYVAVDVYVEEYNEETDYWEQIDVWTSEAENTYYTATQKTVRVDGGHYYRARCEHFAGNKSDAMYDSSVTVTDGIWVK